MARYSPEDIDKMTPAEREMAQEVIILEYLEKRGLKADPKWPGKLVTVKGWLWEMKPRCPVCAMPLALNMQVQRVGSHHVHLECMESHLARLNRIPSRMVS